MATLKQLYSLVHALDKSEKKNLSLMITAMGGQARDRYANALRTINEQQEFDADKLKKKLSADVSGMSLTEANDYFFNFICKSLLAGQGNATGTFGLVKELMLIEIFLAKGLYDVAEKNLHSLLPKLYNHNSFGLLARALELNSTIVASNPETNLDFTHRLQIIDKRREIARDNLQYTEVMRLNLQVTELVHKIGDAREKKHIALYEPIYNHSIWQTPFSEISKQAFAMFAPLKIDMVTLSVGPEQAIADSKLALEEFYRRFNMRDNHMAAFYLLDSLLSNCYRAKLASEIPAAVEQLHQLVPHVSQRAVIQKIYGRIMFSELAHGLITHNYAAGIQTLNHWTQPKNKLLWQSSPLAYMNYILGAQLYYMDNNPDKALDYLLLVRDAEKTFRATMHLTYQFMFLMCYYKLNDYSLVTSTANSIYKSLLKREKLYGPERALLRFVKTSPTPNKMKESLTQLYTHLLQLSTDPLNASFFYYADYLGWLKKEIDSKRG